MQASNDCTGTKSARYGQNQNWRKTPTELNIFLLKFFRTIFPTTKQVKVCFLTSKYSCCGYLRSTVAHQMTMSCCRCQFTEGSARGVRCLTTLLVEHNRPESRMHQHPVQCGTNADNYWPIIDWNILATHLFLGKLKTMPVLQIYKVKLLINRGVQAQRKLPEIIILGFPNFKTFAFGSIYFSKCHTFVVF